MNPLTHCKQLARWATIAIAIAIAIAITALWAPTAQAQAQTQPLHDEWWTPGFAARVKLQPCGLELCGTIVWAWDDQPPGASDKRGLVGQRIISGMKPDVSGKLARHSGSIYNPEDGQTYKATLQLKTPNTLVVNGCVLFICREQIWRRHDSLKTPPVAVLP